MKKRVNRVKSFMYAFVLAFTVIISTAVTGISATETASAILMVGEVSYSGSGDLYGYTTNYVKYGGSFESQHKVQDGWHITAYDSYYSHGVTWYECWDTDDGDYYGWIDSAYLWFYSPRESTSIPSYDIAPRDAEVDGSGVSGYTSNYVLYGGSFEEQHKVQDGWHITAYNTAYSHGVTWYECWDTDDGDYYGWIDSSYIYFYDEHPAKLTTTAKKTTEAARTVISEKTVVVTVTVTVTQPVIEESSQATETTLFAAAMVTDYNNDSNSNSGISNQVIIIIMAIIIVIIIVIVALLIVLVTKKDKAKEIPMARNAKGFDNFNNFDNGVNNIGSPAMEGDLFCVECGKARRNPNASFCPYCGTPYNNQ